MQVISFREADQLGRAERQSGVRGLWPHHQHGAAAHYAVRAALRLLKAKGRNRKMRNRKIKTHRTPIVSFCLAFFCLVFVFYPRPIAPAPNPIYAMNLSPVWEPLRWMKLPPLPDKHGFAGAFAGVSNGGLIVAGGANFPDQPVWEGGKKHWSDKIFVMETPDGQWQSGGALPTLIGYGVSVTTDKGLLCIGGADAGRHYSEVFLLEWIAGKIKRTAAPSLPQPGAYASGAKLGNVIYVAGGTATPTATQALKTFWSLDLSKRDARWQELPAWPGRERMLSVAAAQGGAFYLFSGVSLSAAPDGSPQRTYLKDAYRYEPGEGWTRIADLPSPVVAAPTPAAAFGKTQILIFGGDDGSKAGFQPIKDHPGFSRRVLVYHTDSNQWTEAGAGEAAHVTTALTEWRGGFVIPSGEVRPGVRSPAVWFILPLSQNNSGGTK
jgi:N-acetylneuraminate epimerase